MLNKEKTGRDLLLQLNYALSRDIEKPTWMQMTLGFGGKNDLPTVFHQCAVKKHTKNHPPRKKRASAQEIIFSFLVNTFPSCVVGHEGWNLWYFWNPPGSTRSRKKTTHKKTVCHEVAKIRLIKNLDRFYKTFIQIQIQIQLPSNPNQIRIQFKFNQNTVRNKIKIYFQSPTKSSPN